jgi:hypothetical protein
MAITLDVKRYEEKMLNTLNIKYTGLSWCELGNQIYYGPPRCVAKKLYVEMGVQHTSMDINGQDGALKIDLDQPIADEFLNKFDVITNYGTIEHVDNQYEAFRSVHRMCKCGGVVIHGFPLVGNWPKHCRYYYSKEFVANLVDSCDYKLIAFRSLTKGRYAFPKSVISCVLIKQNERDFLTEEEFAKLAGLTDSKFINRTGKVIR